MNKDSDEQFQNRWDFRRREDDVDSSSDDSKSKSGAEGEDQKRKLLSNLAVPENIEILATPRFQRDNELDQNKDVHVLSEKTAKKWIKPTKKKKNPQSEKTKKNRIEEKKARRRKTKKSPTEEKKTRRRNTNALEKKMSEDLKIFTNSLVQELKVARENMFAQMKEEMRKMMACRSSSGPRTDGFNGLMGRCHNSKIVDLKTAKANGLSFILPNESNHVFSSPSLTLPTVVTKPQLQINLVPSNDCIREATPKINSGSDIDIRKLMNSKNHDGFPAFHPTATQLGSSLISCENSGLNLSQTMSVGLGFPIPGLHQVVDKGSNMSSLTEDCRLGLRMNGSVVKFLEGNPTFSRTQFNRRA